MTSITFTRITIAKMPDDNKIDCISHNVGIDHVVDELILKFTHDREIELWFME